MKESDLQGLVMDWLSVNGIFALRMNTGAVKIDKRFIRFGVPGMADILAFRGTFPVWIELKTPSGKHSALQWSFQLKVQSEGHKYILARSLDDVEKAFR